MCQEKDGEVDSTTLKIELKHRYNDSKNTLNNAEEDLLQWPETKQTTLASTEEK